MLKVYPTFKDNGQRANACRISYSDDGFVWTAYNSQQSDADLGEIIPTVEAATHVEIHPPIRVGDLGFVLRVDGVS